MSKEIKFRKGETRRYQSALKNIKSEYKTGRHIVACLGSAGLTFNNDIERFVSFISQFNEFEIIEAIKKPF